MGRDATVKGTAGGWRLSAYLGATLLLAATVASEPVLCTYLLGQVNALVVWLLVEDWLGRGRLRGWLTAARTTASAPSSSAWWRAGWCPRSAGPTTGCCSSTPSRC